MKFEWDETKNLKNIEKHGIGFQAVIEIFLFAHVTLELSTRDEPCWAAIGRVQRKFFTAIYTKRAGKIRLISARRARKDEEEYYGRFFKK